MLFMPCVWAAAERLCRPLVRYLCKLLQKYEHLLFFTNIQDWKCVRFLQNNSTKTRVGNAARVNERKATVRGTTMPLQRVPCEFLRTT